MEGIDLPILASQVGTFLVAVWIVWKFGWGPLTNAMRDRQAKIRGDIQVAEETKLTVKKLEQEYKDKLVEIEKRAEELMREAKAEGQKAREELVRLARTEADEVRRKAQEQLSFERTQLVGQLRAEISQLAVAVAQKALKEFAGADAQRKRFEDILAELEKTSGKGIAG